MFLSLILIAIVVGALMPIQAGINAELTRFIEHPYLGALISFFIGTSALLILSTLHGLPIHDLKRLTHAPAHYFLGGILGALFVGSSIYLIPRLGATIMVGSIVTGQFLMSLFMDHYGVLGVPAVPLNWERLVGMSLLIIGLTMLMKKA
jgi:bacterial/archaeal transporter family-2 protein